jgi:hypothetical protein
MNRKDSKNEEKKEKKEKNKILAIDSSISFNKIIPEIFIIISAVIG